MEANFDFSGYATKNDLRCSDGRVIKKGAFKHQDGARVSLVWQHSHNTPDNVLGHAVLEDRDDGVYAYCTLNNSESGKKAKILVEHGDVNSLSIWANQLQQNGSDVYHGDIKEVSLVLSGANPGAKIDNVIVHSDGYEEYLEEGEGIITFNSPFELKHADEGDDKMADESNKGTMKEALDIYNALDQKQKDAVAALIGAAMESVQHDDLGEGGDDNIMKQNVFEGGMEEQTELSHSDIQAIFDESVNDAISNKRSSLKETIIAHAGDYGIEDIGTLFPEAKKLNNPPEWIKRDTEWVSTVINGVHKSPFSRIKSQFANLTEEDARARGYIKAHQKKEEIFPTLRRVTTPTTIYKKQRIDRDDTIDITDFNVVDWMKTEMRMMLDEEIARAILLGDGRDISSEDKINEENIRPIWKDNNLFTIKKFLNFSAGLTHKQKTDSIIECILRARKDYKGSGTPTCFVAPGYVTTMLLAQDRNGRKIYNTEAELAAAMRVSKFVEVPLMEDLKDGDYDVACIIVNLSDYNAGTDRGGNINMFDDFDIDYNQYKYLMETRFSGALIRPYSAIVVKIKEEVEGVDATVTMPEDQSTVVFGTPVSDLQLPNVAVGKKEIRGTLKYFDDEDSDLVKAWGPGNFIALKFTAEEGSTVLVGLDPSASGAGLIPLDEDMQAVFKVSNQYEQKLIVKTIDEDGKTNIKSYSLLPLRCTTKD